MFARLLPVLVLAACTTAVNPDASPHMRDLQAADAGQPYTGPGLSPPPYAPLRTIGDRPDVTVYGYWPYWGDPLDTLPWDQLTHVAIFNVDLNVDGSLGTTWNWTNNAVNAVSLAAPHGVKVHLTITSFDSATMSTVLADPTLRAVTIAELQSQVNAYGADGVNVDFEGLPLSAKQDFVSFIEELHLAVPEVYIAMPAVDWGGAYDFDLLAFASDGLFIMGYDYHWPGGEPGPVSPLYGSTTWGSYGLDWSLNDYRTWGAPDANIVMGLPLYGITWPTTNTAVPGISTGSGWSELFVGAGGLGSTFGRNEDVDSTSAYTFPTATSQLWYDDQGTLSDKIDWALSQGVQGIGFWALTYTDSDPAFWSMVDAHTHSGMSLSAPDPGLANTTNQLILRNAPPLSQQSLVYGTQVGSTGVPGCVGLTVNMGNPALAATVQADAQGVAVFDLQVPASAVGVSAIFQVGDLTACAVSNSVGFDF